MKHVVAAGQDYHLIIFEFVNTDIATFTKVFFLNFFWIDLYLYVILIDHLLTRRNILWTGFRLMFWLSIFFNFWFFKSFKIKLLQLKFWKFTNLKWIKNYFDNLWNYFCPYFINSRLKMFQTEQIRNYIYLLPLLKFLL